MEWAKRNSALVQKVFSLFERMPDFADLILDSGGVKLKELKRYAPWVDDYNHCLVNGFPGECFKDVVTLPNGEFMEITKILAEVC